MASGFKSTKQTIKSSKNIGILSVIAGGKGWEDMENYGLSKYDWLASQIFNAKFEKSLRSAQRVSAGLI